MANLTTDHVIDDFTITGANTAEQKYANRTICQWFAVQNNHGTKPLYLKVSDENDTTKSIAVQPGEYKIVAVAYGQMNPYDLSKWRFVSDTPGHAFSVEYHKA